MVESTMIHPDETATASYVEGHLHGAARDRFESHLAQCDECRAGVVLLTGLLEQERGEANVRAAPRRPRRVAVWAAAAVAAGVVVLVGWLLWRPTDFGQVGSSDAPVYRDGGTSDLQPLSPAPDAAVERADLRFRWSPVVGAERYEVVVTGPEGTTLARVAVGGDRTEVAWPEDREPPRGRSMIWTVRALRLGRAIAESRPASFVVRP